MEKTVRVKAMRWILANLRSVNFNLEVVKKIPLLPLSIADFFAFQTCTSFTDVRRVQCFMLDSMRIRPDRHNWLPYQVKDRKKTLKRLCSISILNVRISYYLLIYVFDYLPMEQTFRVFEKYT